MAELPGWDRARLRRAAPADVAAARLLVFAREAKPVLVRDFKAELEDLQERSPRDQERYERRRRARGREELVAAMKLQDALRRMLLLEEPAGG